jgi:hypothetical protein
MLIDGEASYLTGRIRKIRISADFDHVPLTMSGAVLGFLTMRRH